jgi:hypothetical protein
MIYKLKSKKIFLLLIAFCFFLFSFSVNNQTERAFAMPFYSLSPQSLCHRSTFSTDYIASSPERKNNIYLASKALDNTLVAPFEEFSFNLTVGERTKERGYQNAKIILNGEFVDGVGGGVCQVSTTLYNAVLLAGLKIIEYHPHSLSVGYVLPSFDAMVNSSTADLKFLNDTPNPVIINSVADGNKLTITITGEKSQFRYLRKSLIVGEILPPEDKIILDEIDQFPDLYEDQTVRIKNPKNGLISQGYLLKVKDGKIYSSIKIRSDKYAPVQGVLVKGKIAREQNKEATPIGSPPLLD